ncbi:MAG: DUF5752 family protein [Candidatus Bathyarchaeia archaeon]
MAAEKRTDNRIDSELALRVLRTVSIIESFLFFTDVGQYTGEFASCLAVFLEKLERAPLKSIEFHFKRGDFERWIKETLGDEHLAEKIREIDRSIQGEELRTTIQTTVKSRLDQLRIAAANKT